MQNTEFKKMRFPPVLLFFFCTIGGIQQSAGQKNGDKNDRPDIHLDSIIESSMQASGLAGIGAAVIVDKKLVWIKGYGYADQEKNTPFTPGTLLNTGSITKTFTGVCMMRAMEQDRLSLDEDINHYLPFRVVNPYFPDEKITLRDIATHSSGLADREPFYSDSVYYYGSDSPEALGEFLKNYYVPGGRYYSPANFYNAKPGAYWEYSNIAAALAGYIVELRTGMRLDKYSRLHIQNPLKMQATGWFMSGIDLGKHAKLYKKQGDSTVVIPFYSCTTYPDGGVRSSVEELSRFFIALLNEGKYNGTRILKKKSVAEMLRFQFTAAKKPGNLDITQKNEGLFWRTKMNVTRIGHGGSDPGIKTEMLADLSKNVGVILFTNTELNTKILQTGFYRIYEELHKYGKALLERGKNK
jgi:CubicO group peptidase (beta-lactamase class C family)